MKLNSDRIRARRIEIGLTQRALARRMGAGNALVHHIERDGNHGELTLTEIDRLAEALRVDPVSLFVADPSVAEIDDGDTPPATAAASTSAIIGGVLLRAQKPVPLSALTEALGLRREDVDSALADLDRRVKPCGLQLHIHEDCVRLIASDVATVTPGTLKALQRRVLSRRTIDRPQAEILYRTLLGNATAKRISATNNGNVALRSLVNAGLIDEPQNDTDVLQLSADVRESLLLDSVET